MSDINDLIVTNGINSFNIGYKTGVTEERKRVIRIAEKLGMSNEIGEYLYVSDLIEYIEDGSEPGNE